MSKIICVISGFKQKLTLLFIIFTIYPLSVMTTNEIRIQLDPYVSVLDKDNPFRYNLSEILPLISKVATKFTKLYVELTDEDLIQDTSLSILPLAIAHYNGIMANKTAPLEVWLSYSESLETESPFIPNSQQNNKLLSMINQANSMFPETITTLLVSQNNVAIMSQNANDLKIGSTINVYEHCNETVDPDIHLTVPKLIILNQKTTLPKHLSVLNFRDNQPENEFKSILKRVATKCEKYFVDQNFLPTLVFSFSDTNDSSLFDKTRLVYLWTQAENWSKNTGTPIIITKAFDTPYETTILKKTNGWWRLEENSMYSSTAQFIFQEKLEISNQTEVDKNLVNVTWLMQETHFKREYTGIIFNLYNIVGSELVTYTNLELQPILEQMENHFSKVIVLIQDNTLEWLEILPKELQYLDKIKNKIEATLMILPDIKLSQYFHETSDTILNDFGLPHDLFTNWIYPYIGINTTLQAHYIMSTFLKDKNLTEYKFGYLFPIKVCRTYNSKASDEKYAIEQTLNDPVSQLIYFYFEEDEETVKLGARRMYQQRIVEFEECRKIIGTSNDNRGDSTLKELRFIMLHYATNSSNLYKNALALQNLAIYWEMLSNWAGNTKTTVVLSSAVDGTRIFKKSDKQVFEVGWWRQFVNSTGSVAGVQGNRVWLNKKQDALQILYSTLERNATKQDKSFGTTSDVFVTILLPLLGCGLVIALALFLMRRHYRSTFLTESELDNFFLGNENLDENQPDTNAHKVAYDKARYEITKDKFEIDEGSVLGSGEFGKVCKGKVEMDGGTIVNVAIKMANPAKIHKNTLNGMLSEIKVLAYLGNNENVTELIGANTEDLRNGKVLIFLELCQLGSLVNYLRNIRPSIDSETNLECNLDSLGFDERYANLNSIKKVNLDQELSEDLYRWSQQICNGMAFLAEKHVVHADLASRNVLLNLRKEAKICDFGLSRKLYNYTNYVKKHQEPLPWKWMSPEALRLLQFNEKSDVWAFGITMWEIYSLGDTPYPGLSFDLSFAQMLESGFRLSEPKFDDREMHTIMKKCWFTNPAKRPTFSELLSELQG